MTIDEKRAALREHCDKHTVRDCCACELTGNEYSCAFDSDTPENIEEMYQAVFGVAKTVDDSVDEVVTEPVENGLQSDMVNHPGHYETGKFECIAVMIETQGVEAVMNFCICNAFKYLYRHNNKNGLEDIKKAIWYLNKYVELEESK